MGKRVEQEVDKVRQTLAAIPGFSAKAEGARLTRLPGLTNRVYRVDLPERSFALRIPGEGSAAIIDRQREETNARAAAEAGVAPDVVHFGADGVMLTRFVEGEPLTPERITRPDALERVGQSLRHLHDSRIAFAGRFDPFGTIDRYSRILMERGAAPTAKQQAILDQAETVRAALDAEAPPLRPCHCDPTGRNLIDTGKRIWLVDWEYSGMNDHAWDLAYCSIQAGLQPDADGALLSAYFRRVPKTPEAARVAVMKAPVELMSALWALIQESSGNTVADFGTYAERTFETVAERMRSAAFAAQMAALGGG
jgi:thiamine kinase-like enzyme